MRKKVRSYHKKEETLLLDIGIGVLFTLFLISLGLILAINLRPLYYADIKWLNLEELSGLSASVIRDNYDALIDYCSPFYQGKLIFPSLPASTSGLSHFEEVKVIFNLFYVSFVVTTGLLIYTIHYKKRKKQHRYLKIASITTIVLPTITLLGCAIDFDAAFLFFHKLAFRNDDWLFDTVTDPIITILPQSYFLQCALIIVFVVFCGSLVLYLRYQHYTKKTKRSPLLQTKRNYFY